MKKHTIIIALSMLSLSYVAFAAQTAVDETTKRNNRINSICVSLIQTKYNYSGLKGAEREARNRQHASEIQTCYQAYTARTTPAAV